MAEGDISEEEVYAAVRQLKSGPIIAFIESASFDDHRSDQLAAQIKRASSLIMARPDIKREERRSKFFVEIRRALIASGGKGRGDAFDFAVDQLRIAEEGYRRILNILSTTEYSKLAPEARIWAALNGGVDQAIRIRRELHEQIAKQEGPVMAQSLSLRDPFGRPVSADALRDGVVMSAAATLNIEGRGERWLNAEEVFVIPSKVSTTDEDIFKAGSNEYLSLAWRNWKSLEERVRFLGGHLRVRIRPDVPEGFPEELNVLYEAKETPDVFDLWVAQHRINDGSTQSYLQLLGHDILRNRAADIDVGARLPPYEWLDHEEAVAFKALSDTLGYPITEETQEIEGLAPVEWLRGFVVLSVLAQRHLGDQHEERDRWLPNFDRVDLREVLIRNGLAGQKADIFIDEARFRASSVDLYDAPLIECADGVLVGFGPALIGTNHAGVLLSVFSRKAVEFKGKGAGFESKVLDLLRGEGLKATGYKTSRNGEEFEYDALLLWGDYLFVFECKNRSIPQENAVRGMNFLRETNKQVRQVTRLCEAIRRWPEFVQAAFGQPLNGRSVVPVVLNNLPYSRLGPTDGVFFYDYQALNRFFFSRALGFSLGRGAQGTIGVQIDVAKIWRGATPTADDLMAQLQESIQLRFNRGLTVVSEFSFQLDAEAAAAEQRLYREDMTPDAVARIAGIPRHVMKERERKMLKRVKKAKVKNRDSRR